MKRICLLIIPIVLAACSSGKRVAVEQAPVYQPSPESTPVRVASAIAAPKLVEVQEAVKRVFKDDAALDPNFNPNYVAGDFNGDASQDLVVIVRPKNLDDINREHAPWLLRAPRTNTEPRVPLKIDKDELLLAIIHGYGINDWRDPEATQTFVLKNVVGSDLKVQSGKEFVEANAGRKLPRPQGDLIGQTLQGAPGYLYYATSSYSWYDPKTYKGEQQAPGVFHKARTMR